MRSDIISEVINSNKLESADYLINEKLCESSKTYKIETYNIKTKKDSTETGMPIGKYHLLSIEDIRIINKTQTTKLVRVIATLLKDIIGSFESKDNILLVGLGNYNIQADSLGSIVTQNVIITRLLKNKLSDMPKVSAIRPSVMGETGIETADIISAVVKEIKPKKVIIIDSLCASASERLGRSIQITNVGMVPGGGVNRPKKTIDKDSLGCDVITIGIPLMIYASLFGDKNTDKNLVVTFHDVGNIVNILGKILARSINSALLGIDGVM